jgi:hypothetical protein
MLFAPICIQHFFIVIVAMNGVWVATLAFAIKVLVGVQESEIKMT